MYKRLKSGEYQRMTPEQQLEHRRLLRNRWLRKKGNKSKVREWNRRYLHEYWIKKKETPVMRVCKKCGKTVALTGRQTICDKCHAIPSKTKLLMEAALKRAEEKARAKSEKINNIITLARTTDLTQKEIADRVGTFQTVVSKVLKIYRIKRGNK